MTRMCDICGVRPAVRTIQQVRPGQPPETLHLCEIHLAEQRISSLGSGFGGLSMFDDFFSRFLGDSPGDGTVRSATFPVEGLIRCWIDDGGRRSRHQARSFDSLPPLRPFEPRRAA